MVWHPIDVQNFVSMILNDTSYILIQFIFPTFSDLALPVLDGENNLNVYLGIGVGHVLEIYMSYLTARVLVVILLLPILGAQRHWLGISFSYYRYIVPKGMKFQLDFCFVPMFCA
jgi:hypothetical protein